MTHKPILCLDFDGVLHSYTSKWAGATVVADDPVPGAGEFLCRALEKFQVCVLSSRSHEPGGQLAMAEYLLKHFGGSVVQVPGEDSADVWWTPLLDDEPVYVKFPLHKPPAFVTVDDRALTFRGVWPSVDDLLAFKPWNKGGLDPEVRPPEVGSDDEGLWLEAAYAHGFYEVDAHGPGGRDDQGYRCTATQLMRLMASAREQGRRDVLGLPPTGPKEMMRRDDDTLTDAELREHLGDDLDGESIATHSGNWRREGPDLWRFHWYPDCHPDAEE